MRKKMFYIIGLFIILMMMFSIPTYASTGKVNADTLKLRSEASTSSSVIKLIDKGVEVEILSEEGDWYKVKYGDSTGYVSKQYIEISTETVTAETTTQTNDTDTVYKDTKIRILPTINSNIIGELKTSDNITVISSTNNWAFIQKDDTTGWIPLVSLDDNTTATDTTEDDNTTNIVEDNNTIEDSTEANTVENNTVENENTETNSSDTIYTNSVTKYVNTTSIYVRSEASTSSKILITLIENTDVTVTGESGDWYKIKYNDVVGYIRKDLLSDAKTETTSRSGDSVTRTTETTANTDSIGSQIVEYAKQYLDCPYVYGASGPSNFDCSGFTMYVYNHFGYSLPHSATAQSTYGTAVSKNDLQPGDLVFFLDYETMDGIGHCGIYIGDGNFIHASSGTGYCVKISTLLSGSYLTRYDLARRII